MRVAVLLMLLTLLCSCSTDSISYAEIDAAREYCKDNSGADHLVAYGDVVDKTTISSVRCKNGAVFYFKDGDLKK